MPASTTTKAKPNPDPMIPVADAMDRARTRLLNEFKDTSFDAVVELTAKLMIKYTREELKQ